MNTAGIIFLSLGILFILVPSINAIISRKGYIMLVSIISIFCFMLFVIVNYPDPTVNDVKDGKAIYVEQKHVGVDSNGDTLYNYCTYHLEWLPEWKYGRKQKDEQ